MTFKPFQPKAFYDITNIKILTYQSRCKCCIGCFRPVKAIFYLKINVFGVCNIKKNP